MEHALEYIIKLSWGCLQVHSFYAFIDEAGDEGFTFKEYPERASSEWFVLSACVFRATDQTKAANGLNRTLGPIEEGRKSIAHFRSLTHEARIAIVHQLSTLPVAAISVCFNKRKMGADHTLDNSRRLYFYAVRYLIERVSWFVRANAKRGEGNGKCKLTFSHCKKLSYENLSGYLALLKQQGSTTQVKWAYLDDELRVRPNTDSIWLRAADAIASGIYKGLELSPHGFCEGRYASLLKPITYNYNNNYASYGMKVFPSRPPIEKERDNRYGWLALF